MTKEWFDGKREAYAKKVIRAIESILGEKNE